MSYDNYVDYIRNPENRDRIDFNIKKINDKIHSATKKSTDEIFNLITYIVFASILIMGVIMLIYILIFYTNIDETMFSLVWVISMVALPFILASITRNTIYRFISEKITNELFEYALDFISFDIPEIRIYLKDDLFIEPIYDEKKQKHVRKYVYQLRKEINYSIKYYDDLYNLYK